MLICASTSDGLKWAISASFLYTVAPEYSLPYETILNLDTVWAMALKFYFCRLVFALSKFNFLTSRCVKK